MAGSDGADPATAEADAHRTDYLAALVGASLAGKRLGVLAYCARMATSVDAVFAGAVAKLKAAGAEVIEIDGFEPPRGFGKDEHLVLLTELKAGLNAYLATTPREVACRTLADVIAFNAASERELSLFGQELFEEAEATAGLADPAYLAARAGGLKMAGDNGLARLIAGHRLDALIAPSYGPPWRIDAGLGDHGEWGGASRLPAIAGYPHLTVPMGFTRGLPLGLSFIGLPWTEAALLALGHAFEQVAGARRPPSYQASLEAEPAFEAASRPAKE
jgi:amidase